MAFWSQGDSLSLPGRAVWDERGGMATISFLHNSTVGLAHPAQPHIADPAFFFEKPERLVTFLQVAKSLEGAGVTVENWNQPADAEIVSLVHSRILCDEFASACGAADSTVREFGNEFFLGARSFEAARTAVGCAIEGVDRVMTGRATHVVCGCRPPGHHARPNQSMGFCGLSTAAIAAVYGQKRGLRVCVFDYDVHSGNGTIEAVVGKQDILFAEIRTMTMDAFHTEVPFRAYPYPSGCSLGPEYWYDYLPSGGNLVLEDMFLGTTGDEYLERFAKKILPAIKAFDPQLLIISAGFDCMKGDPLGDLGLERRHISTLVQLLVGKGTPSITVLEGGYDLHNIREGLAGHFEGLLAGNTTPLGHPSIGH